MEKDRKIRPGHCRKNRRKAERTAAFLCMYRRLLNNTETMKQLEIERKWRPECLPDKIAEYPHREIAQAYLCTGPVVRVRQDGDTYCLTLKGEGLMTREEYNFPLKRETYEHLLKKTDGLLLRKTRYRIPLPDTAFTAELDVFHGAYEGLLLLEVEFPDLESAGRFLPPDWFGMEVTADARFSNSALSRGALPNLLAPQIKL